MYGEETAERQYSEFFFTQREPEYDQDTDPTLVKIHPSKMGWTRRQT